MPDPTNPYPLPGYPRYCVFLKPTPAQVADIAAAIRNGGGTHPWA